MRETEDTITQIYLLRGQKQAKQQQQQKNQSGLEARLGMTLAEGYCQNWDMRDFERFWHYSTSCLDYCKTYIVVALLFITIKANYPPNFIVQNIIHFS